MHYAGIHIWQYIKRIVKTVMQDIYSFSQIIFSPYYTVYPDLFYFFLFYKSNITRSCYDLGTMNRAVVSRLLALRRAAPQLTKRNSGGHHDVCCVQIITI